MHRFCPRLLKEAAPPPQAAPKAGESATVALEDAASAFVNLSCKLPSGDFDAELMADALNRLRAALAALAAAPSAHPPQAAPKAERDPFIRERAQLEQEWSELRAMKAALSAPAERGVPLTDEQRRLLCERVVGSDPVSLVTAERIVIDTERAHGIKDPAAKGGE